MCEIGQNGSYACLCLFSSLVLSVAPSGKSSSLEWGSLIKHSESKSFQTWCILPLKLLLNTSSDLVVV